MTVALLTSDERHSRRGERVSALAQRLSDATVVTVVTTGTVSWPGAVRVDEADGEWDVAVAFGWRACLHLGRLEAGAYAYYVPALDDALMWQGDEQRVLVALTYELPIALLAPSDALAEALRARA